MGKFTSLVSASLLLIIFCLSCTEERIIKYETAKITVSGKVYGWRCWDLLPYTEWSGNPATVKFIRTDNGCTYGDQTDDASAYTIWPEEGDYFAVIETRHCHPDTVFDITLTHDTVVDFEFHIEYIMGDSVYVEYYYPNPADSLRQATERAYIDSFNLWIGDMLDPAGATRTENWFEGVGWLVVMYQVPTKPEYAPWQIVDRSWRVLQLESFPASFSFYPDYYFCQQEKVVQK